MDIKVHPQDPARHLWLRCEPDQLRTFWRFLDQRPVPVGEIARSLNLAVISKTLPTDISGMIKFVDGNYKIEVNNTDSANRQRFTVSHEIAHYLLHKNLIDAQGITDTVLYRSNISSAKEAEANRLAAAILLPWSQVIAWHRATHGGPPNLNSVDAIATAYKASRLAVGYRFGF